MHKAFSQESPRSLMQNSFETCNSDGNIITLYVSANEITLHQDKVIKTFLFKIITLVLLSIHFQIHLISTSDNSEKRGKETLSIQDKQNIDEIDREYIKQMYNKMGEGIQMSLNVNKNAICGFQLSTALLTQSKIIQHEAADLFTIILPSITRFRKRVA